VDHLYYMGEALKEAEKAASNMEVPIGAVLVIENEIAARDHNRREELNDPTAHAEILVLKQASRIKKSWRLSEATLYVTLEPCPMCAGAMVQARIESLVYGASDPKAGAVHSLYSIPTDKRLNHYVKVKEGVMEKECSALLKEFFRLRR